MSGTQLLVLVVAIGAGAMTTVGLQLARRRDARATVPDAPVPRAKPVTNRLEIVSTTRARPTNPPVDVSARTRPPTNRLEIVSSTRGRPTNPPAVDVLVPLPPTPVAPPGEPGDPIATRPDLELTFRRRNPSTAPPPMHALQNALANPLPPALRGNVAFATILAELSSAGITGNREDGFARLIRWRDVVGIVARRLPPDAPYQGAPFVDIVSLVGSTLRVLPWTEINGLPVNQSMFDPTERLRSLVQLLAAQCLEAQLDPATRTFSRGNGKPAQLPDETMLALHDDKLR